MTKIDIYSGFLGAGKTTLIKKMIQEAYKSQKIVLIENEFGEIGIDGGFLQEMFENAVNFWQAARKFPPPGIRRYQKNATILRNSPENRAFP